jgi:hypothetical protein
MAKWGDGPGWTIDQAMQVLTVLHPAFRETAMLWRCMARSRAMEKAMTWT